MVKSIYNFISNGLPPYLRPTIIIRSLITFYTLVQARIFGSPLTLLAHSQTVLLPRKKKEDGQEQSPVHLYDLLHLHCPHLTGKEAYYTPPLLLANGHLSTIACALNNSSRANQVHYERKVIRVPDGGQIEIDFTPPGTFDDPKDSTPTLVVLHGLTGGSHEQYVREMVSSVIHQLGWRVMVTNFRGCAGSKLTSPRLYHAGATDDLRCALLFLSHLVSPDTPLHGLGFSLGANILAKYLGEEGEQSMLRTGTVLANPWDLYKGHLFMESSFVQRIYSRVLAFSLRSMVKRHLNWISSSSVDIDLLYSDPYQTLYDFDTILTRHLGGFASTENYYKSQSSARLIRDVRVPLLGMNAEDDVISCIDAVPLGAAQDNPFVILGVTGKGGHLGWFEGGILPSSRFVTKPVIEWLNTLNHHLDCSAPPHPSRPTRVDIVTVGGPMVRNSERPDEIGFQLVSQRSVEEMAGVGEQVAKETLKDVQSWEFLKLLVYDGGRAAQARQRLKEQKAE
ncbi:hypothetical protein CROQUDRAFT_658049 [Cronartium quercuum f. sp. fusiforme G11]|uniref:AB hydrolase-1 domain-containing protein n=1 Tax=Cronartium quercuum f. sp. fusiforme G11 TaxID=708437 RepID=A0A9P6TBR3_9BASI|nr:hypothetical protein CROQUDRAFT_658049 [Cronartium quercuum f. sp. fusiforme G11]